MAMRHASSEATDPPKLPPSGPPAAPQPPVLRQSSRHQQPTDALSPLKDAVKGHHNAQLRAPSPATAPVCIA